jgi:hypothetical protein
MGNNGQIQPCNGHMVYAWERGVNFKFELKTIQVRNNHSKLKEANHFDLSYLCQCSAKNSSVQWRDVQKTAELLSANKQ